MDYIAIANQFDIEGEIISAEPFGNGLINSTILVVTSARRYIMQAINTNIFTCPDKLTENIVRITDFLKGKIAARGGDVMRETLTPVRAKNGGFLVGNLRMYHFIEGCVCLERIENPSQFYETGKAFGHFQLMLNDFPAYSLFEVIPDFHNTPKRVESFEQAVENGIKERIEQCENEIKSLLSRKGDVSIIMDGLASGAIPLRVTHNDTKINNIMLDANTLRGVCVIDLDTVMPGSALFDFGDAIRSGANPAGEDESDLSKVYCSAQLFEAFAKGFIEGMEGNLTANERSLMVRAAWTIVYEQAVRFLGDYLMGDVYYGIKYPKHNLVRAKNQLALLLDIECKWDELERIVREI